MCPKCPTAVVHNWGASRRENFIKITNNLVLHLLLFAPLLLRVCRILHPIELPLIQNQLVMENGTTIILWWERGLDHNYDCSRVKADSNTRPTSFWYHFWILHTIELPLIPKPTGDGKWHNNGFVVRAMAQTQLWPLRSEGGRWLQQNFEYPWYNFPFFDETLLSEKT